ncbi:WXG100 family type VII secretion target [Streptomyces sp. H39-C1]|uniref:WXG100 family type VII secretion target n=1 Tax=Streptomyces sp. H39-C1 TaxID=3004355 RepID=UPI0022AF1452|nr:hypothetical protein [Streptomyces sp. H39-C1]MCZ4100241.1 hypothetical protein [Streptomyces sp. H39-C1]
MGIFDGITEDAHTAIYGDDFDARSHEEMLAMVKDADPGALTALSQKLLAAHAAIDSIGSDLNTRVAYVDWQSDGGDAFKEWGKSIAKSTLSLAEYSRSAGDTLAVAAETLLAVKRDMPPVPADAKSMVDLYRTDLVAQHDPDGKLANQQAVTHLERAREGAVDQMNKLALAYKYSASVISAQEPPTFQPVPARILPKDNRRSDLTAVPIDGSGSSAEGSGRESSDTAASKTHLHAGSDRSNLGPIPTRSVAPADLAGSPAAVSADPGTHIASAGTTTPVAPASSTPLTHHPSGVAGDVPSSRTFVPPDTGSGAPPFSSGPNGRVNAGTPSPRLPQAAGSPAGRGPSNGLRLRPVGESGIHGGQATVRGTTSSRMIPKGNVVGAEGADRRSPMGGIHGTGSGEQGGTRGSSGSSMRRLAGQPGGIVGGTRRQGAAIPDTFAQGATNQAGRTSTGGTAPSGVSAITGRAVPNSGKAGEKKQRRNSRRPDYLIEDEPDRTQRDNDSGPPVVK